MKAAQGPKRAHKAMPQVTVSVNGRLYRLRCGDGEEARLKMLAEHLNARIERLALDTGQHGDERLLLMAALFATDELLDLKARLDKLEAATEAASDDIAPSPESGDDGGAADPEASGEAEAEQPASHEAPAADAAPAAALPLAPRQLTGSATQSKTGTPAVSTPQAGRPRPHRGAR